MVDFPRPVRLRDPLTKSEVLYKSVGQSSSMTIKRYVNSLTREMDAHLEAIRDSLISFAKDGALIGAFGLSSC